MNMCGNGRSYTRFSNSLKSLLAGAFKRMKHTFINRECLASELWRFQMPFITITAVHTLGKSWHYWLVFLRQPGGSGHVQLQHLCGSYAQILAASRRQLL